MRTLPIVALLVLATALAPTPATRAGNACILDDGACAFTCEYENNLVEVGVSISEWYNQWRTAEGKAFCAGVLSAACAGHGDCQGLGTGAAGAGSCQGSASGGTITGGCTANECSSGASSQETGTGIPPEVPPRVPPIKVNDLGVCGGSSSSARFSVDETGQGWGETCGPGGCMPVAPVCIFGNGFACGIGVTEASLALDYPEILQAP